MSSFYENIDDRKSIILTNLRCILCPLFKHKKKYAQLYSDPFENCNKLLKPFLLS